MDKELQSLTKRIQEDFQAEIQEFRGDVVLVISPQNVHAALSSIRDDFKFNMLLDVTAVDYWPQLTPRFHLVYQLYSMPKNLLLRVRSPLDGNDPIMDTVTDLYPNANWKEREVWDMFGIHFEGHPDPRRILNAEDWEGHPLRKDYPLGYEEPQFTFNFETIQQKKPRREDLK
jgi:NADH-quinone oxidoreductase subunit C